MLKRKTGLTLGQLHGIDAPLIRLLNTFLIATLGWFCFAYFLRLVGDPYLNGNYSRAYDAAVSLTAIVTLSVVFSAFASSLNGLRTRFLVVLVCALSTYYLLFVQIPFYPSTTARNPTATFFDALRIYWWNYSHQVEFLTKVTCVAVLLGLINARAINNCLIGALKMVTLKNMRRLIAFLRTVGT